MRNRKERQLSSCRSLDLRLTIRSTYIEVERGRLALCPKDSWNRRQSSNLTTQEGNAASCSLRLRRIQPSPCLHRIKSCLRDCRYWSLCFNRTGPTKGTTVSKPAFRCIQRLQAPVDRCTPGVVLRFAALKCLRFRRSDHESKGAESKRNEANVHQ